MKLFYSILILFGLSCNNSGTSDLNTDSLHRSSANALENTEIDGCYWLILQRDTMVVTIDQNGSAISGKMSFDNFEKDGSAGTIQGIIEDSIIKVWYDFESEGMSSHMEVYFKMQANTLVRGLGTVATRGDTSFYSDPADIKFTDDMIYTKVACDSIPSKYR